MKVLKATLIKKLDIALQSDAVIFSKNIFFPHTINYRLASCLASNANHTYLTTHPKFNPIYTQIRVYLMLISHMAAAGEEEGESPGRDPGRYQPQTSESPSPQLRLVLHHSQGVRGI